MQQFTESQSSCGRTGPLEVIWSNLPAQAGLSWAACPGLCLDSFPVSSRMEIPLLLLVTCASAQPPYGEKMLSDVQKESPVFQFVPIASCPITRHHRKSLALSFFYMLLSGIYISCTDAPWAFSFHLWECPSSLNPFLIEEMLQLLIILCPLLDAPQYVHVLPPCTGEPRPRHSTPRSASSGLSNGRRSALLACWQHSS